MYSSIKYSIFFAFIVFSMIANILGAITPIVIEKFGLTLSQGGLLTLSFMVAALVASVPAGIFSDRHGKKRTMLFGIAIMFLGIVSFLFSSGFSMLLLSTLATGIGINFIQVGANTLIEDISKAGEYAKNLNITHALYGAGSFLIPLIVGYLLKSGYGWRTAYLIFAALSVPLFFMTLKSKAPQHTIDGNISIKLLFEKLRDKELMSYALGLFLYVGTEWGIATWLVLFLKNERGIGLETGLIALSAFWALLAIGRYAGGHLAHKFSPRAVLSSFTAGAIISLALSLFLPGNAALYFMPLIGFFLSVIFPTMFSVAIESTKNNKGMASGVLMSAVGCSAIIPYALGVIGEKYGLIASFLFLFVALGYVLLRSLAIKRKHVDIERDFMNVPVLETT